MELEVGFTVIVPPVCPLLQEYVPPPEAVSVVVLPAQVVTGGDTDAVGVEIMVTVMLAVSAHVPLETITEYVAFEEGLTTIAAAELPVLHEKAVPPDAVKVVLLPGQMDVFPPTPAVMLLFTATVAVAVAEQVPTVTKTVYAAVAVGFTTMEEAELPVLQE